MAAQDVPSIKSNALRRTDNYEHLPYSGTVLYFAIPRMRLRITDTNRVAAWFVRNAQAAIQINDIFGHKDYGEGALYPLSRAVGFGVDTVPYQYASGYTVEMNVPDANRAKACGNFTPYTNDPEDSCDEFPFAATFNGAYFQPKPIGSRTDHVPIRQNKSVGGSLVGFYNAQRLYSHDRFWITVIG